MKKLNKLFEKTFVTQEEQESLDAYFGQAFGLINRVLRGFDKSEQADKYIQNIDAVLKRNKISTKVVYRGILNLQIYNRYYDELESLKIGDIYSDSAYLSTSPEFKIAKLWSKGDLILKLNLKRPHGILRQKFASKSSNEIEILLDRNIKFKVINKYRTKNKFFIIEMEMI